MLFKVYYKAAIDYDKAVRELRIALKTKYTHRSMLGPFLFCVYPRSMDGLASNAGLIDYDKQTAENRSAIRRLVYPSTCQPEGWKMIPSVTDLLSEYNIQQDSLTITLEEAIHFKSPSYNSRTSTNFEQIINMNRTLLRCG